MKISFLLLPTVGIIAFTTCESSSQKRIEKPVYAANNTAPVVVTVGNIPLPAGYHRISGDSKSFTNHLRISHLKKDKTVYLYNGMAKSNQQAQYAVLDISVGNRDLQQCADAVMRLRAEYLFAIKRYDAIKFNAGDGTWLSYTAWLNGTCYQQRGNKLVAITTTPMANTHEVLLRFLDIVFMYCGTSTLPASLQSKPLEAIQPGDVLLKPGAPGHAVMVMDVAVNAKGQKIYLLAQSYMPAQNIHILKNPENAATSPWYVLNNDTTIRTPEWTFYRDQLYGWK